jgi:hypothetical protein
MIHEARIALPIRREIELRGDLGVGAEFRGGDDLGRTS